MRPSPGTRKESHQSAGRLPQFLQATRVSAISRAWVIWVTVFQTLPARSKPLPAFIGELDLLNIERERQIGKFKRFNCLAEVWMSKNCTSNPADLSLSRAQPAAVRRRGSYSYDGFRIIYTGRLKGRSQLSTDPIVISLRTLY